MCPVPSFGSELQEKVRSWSKLHDLDDEIGAADFTDGIPGSASRLTVAVKAPATEYEILVSKVEGVASGWRQESE